MKTETAPPAIKIIARSKSARRLYEIVEELEAGIVLSGTEVKSLRAGKLTVDAAYATFTASGVLVMRQLHISEYSHGSDANHEPLRVRKLLLHKSEIRKLFSLAAVKGNALLPLAFYWKDRKVKVTLAVGKGKAQFDKREDLKKREADRELKRATMRRLKSG